MVQDYSVANQTIWHLERLLCPATEWLELYKWSDKDYGEGRYECPRCGRLEHQKHADDCPRKEAQDWLDRLRGRS